MVGPRRRGAGPGTLTLTGNNTYSGPTAIFAGKLVVDGSIASAVTINNTGTLGGSGTVGGITINSGGILAPGDSPGILSVNGNYNQTSGGVLNVEIGGATPGTGFDQVAVSGSATVGGTLNLSLVNGFRPTVGQTFKIITSTSESGNFSTVNSSGFTVSSNASATGIILTVTSVVPRHSRHHQLDKGQRHARATVTGLSDHSDRFTYKLWSDTTPCRLKRQHHQWHHLWNARCRGKLRCDHIRDEFRRHRLCPIDFDDFGGGATNGRRSQTSQQDCA